LVERRYRKP